MSTVAQGLAISGAICLAGVILIWGGVFIDKWRLRRRLRKANTTRAAWRNWRGVDS